MARLLRAFWALPFREVARRTGAGLAGSGGAGTGAGHVNAEREPVPHLERVAKEADSRVVLHHEAKGNRPVTFPSLSFWPPFSTRLPERSENTSPTTALRRPSRGFPPLPSLSVGST